MKQSLYPMALAGALLGLACGPSTLPEQNAVASQTDEIIGGTLATGDPAVVSLSIRYGGSYESLCTGTLIAPKTVLTAAHCIYAYGQNQTYYVTVGTVAATPTRAVQVAQQYKHPSYNQAAWDFGLLRLATPILDVTPIAINETPMTGAHVGLPIRHVGFGLTVANSQQSGTKREVTYNLRQVTAYTLESGASGFIARTSRRRQRRRHRARRRSRTARGTSRSAPPRRRPPRRPRAPRAAPRPSRRCAAAA